MSEVLEEAGLDRESARRLRRQVLQGMVLFCQWQLERMDSRAPRDGSRAGAGRPRARRVPVEQG